MPRYIDADALLVSAYHLPYSYNGAAWLQVINDAPTADVAPVVRGEWSQKSCFDEDENVYVCSVCDEPWTLIAGTPLENNMHHCPNCGADMRRESEERE